MIKAPAKVRAASAKRDATKVRNREAFLQAGWKLFTEHGFEGCTIRDIIRESGLSPGSFYNYFQTKEAVFDALMTTLVGDLHMAVMDARVHAKTPYAFLYGAYHAYTSNLLKRPGAAAFLARNLVHVRHAMYDGHARGAATFIDALRHDLESAMDSGFFKRCDPEWLSAAMVGAGFEVIALSLRRGKIDPHAIGTFLADLFLESLHPLTRDRPKKT
jgi:AcrR family transcriptional regulator